MRILAVAFLVIVAPSAAPGDTLVPCLALDELLVTASADDETVAEAVESRRSILNELKVDAGAIRLESVLTEIGLVCAWV